MQLFRRSRGSGKQTARPTGTAPASPPLMLALEPRMLFDGAAAATAVQVATKPASHPALPTPLPPDAAPAEHAASQAPGRAVPHESAPPAKAVVFVDGRLADAQQLVNDVKPGADVVVLDPNRDGVEQIADYLKGRHDLTSVSILSHGDQGVLLLGDASLSAGSLGRYADQLHAIGSALAPGGDLFLYGCDVGAGSVGHSFVDALGRATGAHVAASADATGAASLGGNWDLEVTSGSIKAAPMLDPAALGNYDHLLATQTAATASQLQSDINTDATNGTADTITLTANIDLSGTPISIKVTDGQKLTIVGGGYTIDAHYLSRVISVQGGNVELDNLTIQHGLVAGKGGSATPGNTNGATYAGGAGYSGLGGGIYNAGTLTLSNVTVRANYASGGGGSGSGSTFTGTTYGNNGGGGGGGVNGYGGGNGGAYQRGDIVPTSGSIYSRHGGTGGSGVGGGGGAFYDTNNKTAAYGADGSAGGAGGTAFLWTGTAYSSTPLAGGSGGNASSGGAGGASSGEVGGGAGGNGGWTGKIGGGGGGGGYAYYAGNSFGGGRGGSAAAGIFNAGTLYIGGGVTLSGNQAAGGGGGGANYTGNVGGIGGSAAGGILNTGTLHYDSATLTLSSNAGAAGSAGHGANGATNGSAGSAQNDILNSGGTVDSSWISAPTTTVTGAALSADTGVSSTDWITDTASQTVSGTLSANLGSGESVQVSFDGGSTWANATSFSVGSNTWSDTVTLAGGSSIFEARVSNSGGSSTAFTHAYTLDTTPPVVTDANISIAGASGTGGAYKIGDTVTATWNDTSGGDNNTDVSGATADFSQFGGGTAVAMVDSSGTWTATYTITSGSIDATNRNVSVSATDIAGNVTTTADTTNATVDNQAPTVTDANISIAGASGIGGAYKIGDTVTATWNDTATGDNNSDTISNATADFSQFGGGAAVAMSNASGIWTASYTIAAGSIDATNRNVSVSVTDNAGNVTTAADTTNATVDNQPPTLTDANISISGASGTGGAYKIGDVVTATWNDTAGGDNNADTMSSVTTDFSQFGGGAAVAMTNGAGTWSATYTITAGAIDAVNRNVSVSATDNAGNTTTTADTTNATVDNIAPTVTDANISIAGASGTGGAYKVGDTVTATWNDTATGDNNSDTISNATADFSQFGGGAAVAMSNSSGTWTATYTITLGSIDATNRNVSVSATDNAGNVTTAADTTNATVDNQPPTLTDANISISGATGTGGAYRIGDTVTATWNDTATGDNNADVVGATVDFSQFGGGAAVAMSNSGGSWSATYTITAGGIDAVNRNVRVTATDDAGNISATFDSTNATVDNIAPTVTDANISIAGATGSGGAYVSGDTLTATWNDTATGDNNSDTIPGATADFSQFGGGSAVAMVDSGGTWAASYVIPAAGLNATNRNVSVTAIDNAGNTTTTADTTNATVQETGNSVAPLTGTGGSLTLFSAQTVGTGQTFAPLPAIAPPSRELIGLLARGVPWDLLYGERGPDVTPPLVLAAALGRGRLISDYYAGKEQVFDALGSGAHPWPEWGGRNRPGSSKDFGFWGVSLPIGRLRDRADAGRPASAHGAQQHVAHAAPEQRGFTAQLLNARARDLAERARLASALRGHRPPDTTTSQQRGGSANASRS